MQAGTDGKAPVDEILSSVGTFCLIFLGSIVIGTVTALLVAFVLKRQSSHTKEQIRVHK